VPLTKIKYKEMENKTKNYNRNSRAGYAGALLLAAGTMLMSGGGRANAQSYLQTNLVTDDQSITAASKTDPNLINPWGIALSPTGGAFWTSNNGSGRSGLYTGNVNGSTIAVAGLAPTIPGPTAGVIGTPTGQIFNGTSDFKVGTTASSFITASEDGTLAGWGGGGAANLAVDNSASGAVYKGLAIGSVGSSNFLYAANFNSGHIDVFNGTFGAASLAGSFTDPNAPAGYAPFNVQNLGGSLYVTYAQQDADKHDEIDGAGKGFVDVYNTSGNLLSRVATGSAVSISGLSALNAPWGLALAPSNFGAFSNDLLVGNFGSGQIDAFNPTSGAFLGAMKDANGNPIVIDGLWGLSFGNGVSAGDQNVLYFTAGTDGEAHGLFGSLSPAAAPEPSECVTFGLGSLLLGTAFVRRRRSA
jgi:uncharacterized protein (TIGR03118 family)